LNALTAYLTHLYSFRNVAHSQAAPFGFINNSLQQGGGGTIDLNQRVQAWRQFAHQAQVQHQRAQQRAQRAQRNKPPPLPHLKFFDRLKVAFGADPYALGEVRVEPKHEQVQVKVAPKPVSRAPVPTSGKDYGDGYGSKFMGHRFCKECGASKCSPLPKGKPIPGVLYCKSCGRILHNREPLDLTGVRAPPPVPGPIEGVPLPIPLLGCNKHQYQFRIPPPAPPPPAPPRLPPRIPPNPEFRPTPVALPPASPPRIQLSRPAPAPRSPPKPKQLSKQHVIPLQPKVRPAIPSQFMRK
jgi:hypothetical protein